MSYWKKFSKKLIERDGKAVCHYCGAELMDPAMITEIYETMPPPLSQQAIGGRQWGTVDHVVPRAKGGSDELDNLVLACHDCNCRKGAR